MDLTQDQLLQKAGERIHHVYFPLDSFILLAAGEGAHDVLGVALVGHETMLGAWLLLGMDTAPLLARVQGGGSALRMPVADFSDVLATCPEFERRLRAELHLIIRQMAQTTVCAVFHVVEVRLAYWLLMIHDRAPTDRFYLTHDRLARMLGVRRSGVTTAAGLLQRRKLVNYTRGHIVVLNRRGLEKASCPCYRVGRVDARKIVKALRHEHGAADAGSA
ncbi:Crp/Fnr family transcriptional regulator [Sinimarinibacterium flocculans]|uniref:Crp/Fnr family transcriptional regulator n=1 Tax=Sinimarinibacterium flocculans TaxID=985250 RepID=UPI00248FE8FD|nr:Crp/Fnr family transcriptional regulator [Sinimarinibacterium flocculans]